MNTRIVPGFRRQDSHKKGRIKERWRSARGLQSKVRLALNGYLKVPKNGYGADSRSKGKTKNGIIPVEINQISQLSQIKKGEGVIIQRIGTKKKIEIVKEAIKLKIILLNVKNPKEFVTKVEADITKRKELKKKKIDKKKINKGKANKTAEDKIKKESELPKKTEEELKKEKKVEQQEKNKILTSKNQ